METSRSTCRGLHNCMYRTGFKMGVYPIQQCEQAVGLLKDCLVSLTTKLSSNGASE